METAVSTDIGAGTRLLLQLWKGRYESGSSAAREDDWQALLAACDYHQVSSIVFHRLQQSSGHFVPKEIVEQVAGAFLSHFGL
jgi:hypothetical protein